MCKGMEEQKLLRGDCLNKILIRLLVIFQLYEVWGQNTNKAQEKTH